jgi:uncharacterized protein
VTFGVRLRFHGGLDYFLKGAPAGGRVERQLKEPTSVKDAIESCGVPHPEVDRILANGVATDFAFILRENTDIDVYPVGFTDFALPGMPLQRRVVNRFLLDGHLGKLARNLRFLGIDIAYDAQLDDPELLKIMMAEQRGLLTRDRRLLMHSVVSHGYCPRSPDPTEQTIEVVRRFELISALKPFTRCIECNAPLQPVDKGEILDQLEPLTRVHYHEFRRCSGCGKVFWRGSHYAKLEGFLQRLRTELGESHE